MLPFGREFAGLTILAIIFLLVFIWQDTLLAIFDYFFPHRDTIIAKLLFSIIVTVIAILVVIWLSQHFILKNSIILEST